MKIEFEILKQNRKNIIKLIEPYTFEQLNKVPEGFNNNILWNITHLAVTQQLLCYKLSGLDSKLNDKLISQFRKGTAPTVDNQLTEEDFESIKKDFLSLPLQLEEDYKKGLFTNFKEYTTSANITLKNIDDAIQFNNFHEGLHFGSILAIRKFI